MLLLISLALMHGRFLGSFKFVARMHGRFLGWVFQFRGALSWWGLVGLIGLGWVGLGWGRSSVALLLQLNPLFECWSVYRVAF